jgi:hypothetical protein
LAEVKTHFEKMTERREFLRITKAPVSDSTYATIIISSMPNTYRTTIQMVKTTMKVTGKTLDPNDLIAIFIEEAEHRVIGEAQAKHAEAAMIASQSGKKTHKKGRKGNQKGKMDVVCENCHKPRHTKENCYHPGGGKKGQAPSHWKLGKKKDESANVAKTDDDDEIFAFACSSDFQALATTLKASKTRNEAIIDSGASCYFCPDKSKFLDYKPIDHPIKTADGQILKGLGMGNIRIELPNGKNRTPVLLKECIYAPDLAFTLISVSQIVKVTKGITFKNNHAKITHPDGHIMVRIPESQGLYRLVTAKQTQNDYASAAIVKINMMEAHRKLGHIACSAIRHMVKNGMITGLEIDLTSKEEFCEPCAKAKATHKPFPKESSTRATHFGERVHWDLWGPASMKSLGGKCYAACRTDDNLHEVEIYFLKKKSEALEVYKTDEALIETHCDGAKIKFMCSDRGGEFMSEEFKKHLQSKGTKRKLTVHDSPQQDGVSERGMRTRAEHARALLIASGLPRFLWAEAMRHCVWSMRALDGKTPYEMSNGKKPHLANIQEFSAAAYVKDLTAGKLDARAQKGRLVGYDSESKGYRIYWLAKRSVSCIWIDDFKDVHCIFHLFH